MTSEERRQSLSLRSVVVLNAGCMPGDLFDDELDVAEKAIATAEQNPTETAKEALRSTFSSLFHSNYLRRVRLVNEPLLPLGRLLVPTYITNGTIRGFETLAREWQNSAEPQRTAIGESLSAAVGLAVTLPHYRSMHVYQAMRVPKAAAIAHYLEKASQHFYAQDYFSAMMVLLPAVEKLILFHIGHLTDAVISTAEMRSRIQRSVSKTVPEFQPRYAMYKELVLRFIERFQQRACIATSGNTGSSIFRNRIYHLANDDRFYTYDECVTLFCFFDAYIQLLALEDDCEIYGAVPDNMEIRERAREYWLRIFEDYVLGSPLGETQMIATGPYYFTEAADQNYLISIAPGIETKRVMLHALLMIGPEKVQDFSNRLPSMRNAERATILATGISDYLRFHALGMKVQGP